MKIRYVMGIFLLSFLLINLLFFGIFIFGDGISPYCKSTIMLSKLYKHDIVEDIHISKKSIIEFSKKNNLYYYNDVIYDFQKIPGADGEEFYKYDGYFLCNSKYIISFGNSISKDNHEFSFIYNSAFGMQDIEEIRAELMEEVR